MKKHLSMILLLVALLVPWAVGAQNTISTFPWSCDFETVSDNNVWTISNNSPNGWYIGTAVHSGGTHALYVSNNSGTSNAYDGTTACVSYAYVTFDVASAGQYAVQFDWKCGGESTYDFLRVAVASSSTALPTTYSDWTATSVPTNFMAVDGGSKLNLQGTTWQTHTAVVSVPAAGSYRLIFVWRNDGSVTNSDPAAIDNVVVTELTCPQPTALTVSNISATSATFNWTAGGSETSWVYSINGIDWEPTTTNTVSIDTLTGNTLYTFRVRSYCGASDTSLTTSITFRTACVAISVLPYENDFEAEPHYTTTQYADAFPDCWHRINDASGTYNYYPYLTNTTNYVHSGSVGMYWYHSTSTTYANNEYAVLPPIDTNVFNISDLVLSFYAKTTSTSYHPQPIIGVMTDPTDASTFTPYYTFTATEVTTTWELFTINFSNYTGYGDCIAIKWPRPSSTCYLAIDDIYLTDEFCDVPHNVTASTTIDELTISWEPNGGTNFEVTLNDSVITNVTDTSYTFTGLNANTLYNYSVATECSNGNSYPIGGSIRTLCTMLDTLPYTQTFEAESVGGTTSTTFANCMTRLNNGTQYFGYPYVSSSSSYNHTPGGSKGLYWYNTTTVGTYGDYQIVVLPGVDTDSYPINNLQLRFWARATGTSYNPVFQVGVMTNPNDASTFQLVETVNVGPNTTYSEFTVALTTYTGNGQFVAIRALRPSSSWYATVDDITLETVPSCPAIVDLDATATAGAALLTWNHQSGFDAPAAYVVTYDSIGGTNPTTMTVTTNTALLTGLADNTSYKAYVYADCGSDGTGRVDSITFTTERFGCIGLTEVQVSNSTSGISGCIAYSSWGNTVYQTVWTAAELTAAGLTAGPISAIDLGFTASTSYNKEFTIFLKNSSTTSISTATIETPGSKFYGPASHPMGTAGWQHYELDSAFTWDGTSSIMMTTFMNQPAGVSQSSSSGLTGYYVSATNKARYRYQDNTQWTTSNLTSGSGGTTYSYRAAVHFYAGACTSTAICAEPLVYVTDMTANSVDLMWIPGANETSWDVDYRAADTVTWTNAATGLTTNTLTVTSLAPGTDYIFRVSFVCNNAESTVYTSTATTRTPCVEISIPYYYGFEDLSTSSSNVHPDIPCWNHLNNGTSYPGYPYVSSTAHNGTRSLYWYLTTTTGTYGDYEVVVLPPVDTTINPVNSLQLTFWAKPTSTSYSPVFLVGVMTDPQNVSTFQTVQTINVENATTDWKMYEAILSSYTGTGRYVAIRANRPSSSWYAYLDDVTLESIPSCPHVNNIHTTLVTQDSIMLAWTPGSTETEWIVSYGDTSIVTTEDSLLVTNLTPSTYYTFSIVAVCASDDSSAAATFTASTACGLLNAMPYVQDFESEPTGTSTTGSAFAHCWTRLNNGTSYGGYPYNSATASYNHTPGGSKGLYWYLSTTTGTYGDYEIISLPEVDTTTLPINTLMLTFWAKPTSTSYYPVFYVGVMTNPNVDTTFQYYDTINVPNNTEWHKYTVLFDNFVGEGSYIAIRANRPSSAWYANIDDITLDLIPDCPVVEDLTVTSGPTSAILSWTNISENYNGATVEYKEAGTSSWTTLTVPSTYAVITGLTPSTHYDARVYSSCTEGSGNPVSIEFATGNYGCLVIDTTLSDTLSIGNGTSTSYYIPIGNFYNYSYTQELIMASEMNGGGVLTGIDLEYNYSSAMTDKTNVTIYLANTSVSSLSGGFVPYSSGTFVPVYTGSLNCTNGWNHFDFTTPFAYDGSSNLLVVIHDNSGAYDGSAYVFNTHSAPGKGRYIQNDSSPYSLSSVSGGTAYDYRANMRLYGYGCSMYGTCAAPVAIVSDITSSSATLVWTPGNTDTVWNVYYRLTGDATFTTAATGVTATTYTINGLNSGVSYDFKIENSCSGNTYATTVSAVTNCAAITLPYTENFNNWGTGSGVLPNCWYRTGSYSTYTYIIASQNMTGATGGSIYMYSSTGTNYSTLILPELDTTLYHANQTQLVFSTKYTSTSYGRPAFAVGVVTDPNDFSTFVPVDTVQHSGGINRWETFEVPLAAYTGNGAHVALRTVYDSTSTYPYLDDFTLELIPTCPRPDSLTALNATTNSVDLAWHDRAGAAQWLIEYGPLGFQLGTGTQVIVNTNPFTLTGLPAAYQGEYYVKAICGSGDTGEFSRYSYSFNTSQVPATLPYNYDFENGTEWANWQTSSNSATNNWFRGTAVADSGSYSMYMSADAGATYVPYSMNAVVNAAAYRDIDFGPIDSSYTVSFRARVGGTTTAAYDGLMVFLVDPSLSTVPSNSNITSPWGNVNDLYRIATVRLDTNWQTYEASFDTISGIHRVAFFWFNQNTGASYTNIPEAAAVDNIHIDYSTCPRPLNLDTVVVSGDNATLTWTGEANATYEVAYRVSGGTNHFAYVTTNSVTLTGLNSNSSYLAWVRKLCGVGDTSLWSDGVSFHTGLCNGAVMVANYDSTMTSSSSSYSPIGYSFFNYSYTQTIIDSVYMAQLGGDVTAFGFEPTVTTAGDEFENMTVYMANVSESDLSSGFIMPSTTNVFVKVIDSASFSYTETGIHYQGFTTPFVWDGHSNVLFAVKRDNGSYTSGATFAAHTASASKMRYIYQDSGPYEINSVSGGTASTAVGDIILVSCGGGCYAPTIANVTKDYESATITVVGNGLGYEMVYGTDLNNLNNTLSSTTGIFNLTGLAPATNYYFQVRQSCEDNEVSPWADGFFVTDTLPCLEVTGLDIEEYNYNSVTVSWTAGGDETHWEVMVYSTVDSHSVSVQTVPTATVTGLMPQRIYNVMVRPMCGGNGTVEGPWCEPLQFTTSNCTPVSDVTVTNITGTTATVSWTAPEGATNFRVAYGLYDFSVGDEIEIYDVTSNPFVLTDLEVNTDYTVQVANICTESLVSSYMSANFTTTDGQGIDAAILDGALSLFPNPASTMVTLSVSEQFVGSTVSIVDVNGRVSGEWRVENGELTIDISEMAKGAYFVRLTGEQTTVVRKLIVE